jgi:hypothetical protein
MMLEESLRGHLLADSTIAGLIADRAYMHIAPKDTAFPCVVLDLTSAERDYSLDGPELIHSRCVIASIAGTWHDARVLHDAVVATLPHDTRTLNGFPVDSVLVVDERDAGKDQVQAIWQIELEVDIVHQ